MRILRHLEQRSLTLPKPILTMGNFDGIHLGHQALLHRVVQEAKDTGGCSVVLTFEPHPLRVLAPDRVPRLLLTHRDKLRLLESCGVQVVIIQKFDSAFANIEAGEFVQRYLVDRIKVHKVYVGKDFGFGKGKKGRAEDLIRWGAEKGFAVEIVERCESEGVRISSSHIRRLIEAGEV
ncbi:MAG: bifunctional riboflavin kinase/FAD synthetase, partial [Candidatus Binatia bacterium]